MVVLRSVVNSQDRSRGGQVENTHSGKIAHISVTMGDNQNL